jgi:hypothetical protein
MDGQADKQTDRRYQRPRPERWGMYLGIQVRTRTPKTEAGSQHTYLGTLFAHGHGRADEDGSYAPVGGWVGGWMGGVGMWLLCTLSLTRGRSLTVTGAEVNVRDNQGFTPVERALEHDNKATALLLVTGCLSTDTCAVVCLSAYVSLSVSVHVTSRDISLHVT